MAYSFVCHVIKGEERERERCDEKLVIVSGYMHNFIGSTFVSIASLALARPR